MTQNLNEIGNVVAEIEFDLNIEELEAIIAPQGVIVGGPHYGALANHNETMVKDAEPGLEEIEELEELIAPGGIIILGPFGGGGLHR